MNREQFLRMQARELDRGFSLTKGEEVSRKRFEQLAFDTFLCLASLGLPGVVSFSVRSTGAPSFLAQQLGKELPASLVRRWENWSKEYQQIIARNPQRELKDMMHDISESHMCASWPVGYEDVIQDWVDAGDPTASPFFVTPQTGTVEFYNRLRELRQLCGGWLYCDSESNEIVFAPESEWQEIRAEKDALRAEEWRRREQRNQLAQFIKLAVADPTFWAQFKDRAFEQEMIKRGERKQPLSPSIEELVSELVHHLFPKDHLVPINEAIHELRRKARVEGGLVIKVRTVRARQS